MGSSSVGVFFWVEPSVRVWMGLHEHSHIRSIGFLGVREGYH